MTAEHYLAIDLGAESGRLILGRLEGGRLGLEEIHRFPNGPVRIHGHLHWDVLRMWSEILHGLRLAARSSNGLTSLGVDTWGVDFGLLDKTGGLIGIADNLVKTHPQDPQGYILESGLAVKAGKIDEAIGKLKKASELDPKRVRTLIALGNLYLVKRDRKSAQQWYDKALAADPNSVEITGTFGWTTAPGDIKRAVALMCWDHFKPQRGDLRRTSRVSTQDVTTEYLPPDPANNIWTGIPEVDDIIRAYRRVPGVEVG